VEREAFSPDKWLAVPALLVRGWAMDSCFCSPLEKLRLRCAIQGKTPALVQDPAVESADGKDFGVPIMKGYSLGLGKLGCWKTFHPRSVGGV
jgi:hypothetical protein